MPYDSAHPTLADVADLVRATRLSDSRKRDLLSALRRTAELLNSDPRHVSGDVAFLREKLASMTAAEAGVSAKTFANLRANLLAAVAASGIGARIAAHKKTKSPAWALLLETAPVAARHGLSRFSAWCSERGITPKEVDTAAFQAFEAAVRTQTLTRNPEGNFRKARRIWNLLAQQHALRGVEKLADRKKPRLDWDGLPTSFRADVEAHLDWAAGTDPMAEHVRPRPLSAGSLRLRRQFIHSAATSLVEAGWSPSDIKDLRTLTAPAAFRALMRHRHEAQGKAANAYNEALGKALVAIAAEWTQPEAAQLAELKALRARLPTIRPGLTQKNKTLLRTFNEPAKLGELLHFPKLLWRRGAKLPSPARRLKETQAALAIAILLHAPMRISNLASLAFDVNLFLPASNDCETVIELDAASMKKREPFMIVAPKSVTRMLRAYQTMMRNVWTSADKRLFVNADGSAKTTAGVAQIIQSALHQGFGVRMTPHQFRHLAAKIMLDAEPGSYESVRQLLGQKNIKTTVAYYTGLDTMRAGRMHAEAIAQRLAKRGSAKRAPFSPSSRRTA